MNQVAARWFVTRPPDPDQVTALSQALNLPPTLAALLVQRGYTTREAAVTYLRPPLDGLSDPLGLQDMSRAVDVIARAVRAGDTILVHGDYDVDGQCGTALLTRTLRAADANVVPFVPHRLRDGYDFGPAGVAAAQEHRAAVIITVDCGVTAHAAVARAKELGHAIVVTDHHVPGQLPAADAILNPHRQDGNATYQPFCGTGVAFKLAQALVGELKLPANLPLYLLDLVALASVADIVPLVGENRTLVRAGLKMLAASRWPGVRALVTVTGFAEREIRAGHVGYILAPRLNAVGRLGDAKDGLRLLLTDDDDEARRIAGELEAINARRQHMDQEILDQAIEDIEQQVDLDREYALVLARDGWHPGVIGIVASRIVERFGRPTILIALDGDEGRGSGRSIPEFDMHQALVTCSPLLSRFGGHAMAAGLTVRRDVVPQFREALNAVAREVLEPDDLVPTQRIDLMVQLDQLDFRLEKMLRALEPCGPGNPAPVFGVERVWARDPRVVGGKHLRMTLDDGSGRIAGIGFDWGDRLDEGWNRSTVDVAFRLEREEWQGISSLQARVVDIRTTG